MKGIIFRPDMIKAIQEGRKTQARRVIKPQPLEGEDIEIFSWFAPEIKENKAPEGLWMEDEYGLKFLQKPRYQVGETVYIKEAWCIGAYLFERYAEILYKSELCKPKEDRFFKIIEWNYWLTDKLGLGGVALGGWDKWKSPLFMPAWAARYFIKIKDVRAERLQEIPYYEIPKEGIQGDTWSIGKNRFALKAPFRLTSDFKHLWNSINAKPKPVRVKGIITHYESYPWMEGTGVETYRGLPHYIYGNPWVWRYEFEKVGR